MKLKVIVKEQRNGHLHRLDELCGSPEDVAAHIVQKYGGKSILSMPAHEFLNMKLPDRS